MGDVKTPSRREEQARATRAAVVRAATELFVAQGYAATTMDQIATVARVSRPTVFAAGSKPRLLALARDLAMAGDDEQTPVSMPDSTPLALPGHEGVDVLWTLMAPDLHTRLVRERGWSRDRYVGWLAHALRAHLVA